LHAVKNFQFIDVGVNDCESHSHSSDERSIFNVVRNPMKAKRCEALRLSILDAFHLQQEQ
jgi:hypothetical protein